MIFQADSKLNQIVGVLHKKLREEGNLEAGKTGIFITMDGNISPRICKVYPNDLSNATFSNKIGYSLCLLC